MFLSEMYFVIFWQYTQSRESLFTTLGLKGGETRYFCVIQNKKNCVSLKFETLETSNKLMKQKKPDFDLSFLRKTK
jgi:hypothetical protein